MGNTFEPTTGAPSVEALYAELRRLARRELFMGGQIHQMSATTLWHEAHLQMSSRPDLQFADRAHFMAYAESLVNGMRTPRSPRSSRASTTAAAASARKTKSRAIKAQVLAVHRGAAAPRIAGVPGPPQ